MMAKRGSIVFYYYYHNPIPALHPGSRGGRGTSAAQSPIVISAITSCRCFT